MGIFIILLSIVYIGLMIDFFMSKNTQHNMVGRIMLGIIITILLIPIIFFIGCLAIFISHM